MPQIGESSQLKQKRSIVKIRELVIDTRGEDVIALRSTDRLNEWSDSVRGLQCRRGRILIALLRNIRRRRQRKQWVLIDWNQRIDKRRIKKRVVLVRGEKESLIAAVIDLRKNQRATQSKSRIVFLKRQTLDSQRVVLPRIRIQRFIAKEIKRTAAKLIRTRTRPQIDATTGRTPVFGCELIANDLNFLDGFERRREAFARRTIVVVVETIDRDVVRVGRTAGQREAARLFRRSTFGRIVCQIASRKRFFTDAA